MTDLPSDPEPEQGVTPVNTGTLYSLAQAQVTRYWDFSASRRQVRGQFRPPLQPLPQVSGLAEPSRQPTQEAASRWHALHSVFAPPEPVVTPPVIEERPPMLAVFSMAGGVGKTCLVATLGRALSALGEHVLLADTTAGGLLPFYFGSRASNPTSGDGAVRTFSPIGVERDAPVKILNLEPERYPRNGGGHDPLLAELISDGGGASRILVDLATASRDVPGRLLALRPTFLVPLLPDMSSLASLGSLQALLARDEGAVYYLLNQFDGSLPLHRDVREMLQRRLGDRLAPLVLRRSAAVSEALAEGMTVIDYAPDSATAEDYWNLAGWLRSLAAPAARARSGVRWTER